MNLGAGDNVRGSALGVIDQMGKGGATGNEEISRKGKEEFERGMARWGGEYPIKFGISPLKLQGKAIKLVQACMGRLQLRIRLPHTERRALPLHPGTRAVLRNTVLRALPRHMVPRTLPRNTDTRALPLRPMVSRAQAQPTVMVSRVL